MKRMLLCFPAILMGLPLLAGLLLASPRSNAPTEIQIPEPIEPVAIHKRALSTSAEMEAVASNDPIAFLENCIGRYRREVQGYSVVMHKKERIAGKEYPEESIEVQFREKPFSVYFNWLKGARKAERVLYVEGENLSKDGHRMLLARPKGAIARMAVGPIFPSQVDGADAKASGRYTLDHSGINKATERTLAAWQAAKDAGTLQVEYLGVQNVEKLDNRPCWVLRRVSETPENDGIVELIIYIDKDYWLQTGSIVRGVGGKLIGEYYFRDLKLNPTIPDEQFKPSALDPTALTLKPKS